MKAGKLAAAFAVIMIAASVILGESVPFLQSSILKSSQGARGESLNESYAVSLGKGDYVYFGRYLDKPVLWKVLDIKGEKPLLMTEYIICFKAFDANGKNGDYHKGADTEKYGSSDWNSCTLKQWLNSSEEKVSYSHCPPDKASVYLGYNAYAQEKGFLCKDNFTPEQKSLISEKGVFILTAKELNEYLTAEARRKTCADSAIAANNLPYLLTTSKKLWYWTATPASSNNVSVATVTSSGGIYKTLAYDSATGVCPSLYFEKTEIYVCSGNGSEQSPYVII